MNSMIFIDHKAAIAIVAFYILLSINYKNLET